MVQFVVAAMILAVKEAAMVLVIYGGSGSSVSIGGAMMIADEGGITNTNRDEDGWWQWLWLLGNTYDSGDGNDSTS